MYGIRIHGNSIDRGILGSNSDLYLLHKKTHRIFLKKVKLLYI